MADIKVRDLTDTTSITLDNQVMVLTNDEQNQVQNITVENLLSNVLSSDNGNVLEQGTDGKLYVETPENITGELSDLSTTNKSTLVAAINEVDSDLATEVTNRVNAVSGEATIRANADNNLQTQIDAITAASDVTDIVGTYAQLQAYDTTGLPDNSIIKVLQDESRQDETTYYRWVITGGVGAWVLIGEEGPYYTKSQADNLFATQESVGNLNNLATSDKSSVVNAINELSSVLDPTQTADYIKNSKAIYSGEVSENALILPQIKEMAHSTFDSSKFTIVGEPNITDDGIASGFGNGNYIRWHYSNQDFSSIQKIQVKNRTIYKEKVSSSSIQVLLTMGGAVEIRPTGVFSVRYGVNTNIAYNFSPNDIIDVNLILTQTSTSLEVIVNDTTYLTNTAFGDNTTFFNRTAFDYYVGVTGSVDNEYYTNGEIDLKYLETTVDGVEVFSGNKTGIDNYIIESEDDVISIPYTMSKTGSKIVSSEYRSEVLKLYKNFKYAPYYTLDEENGNFTLPMGEIYGMIENAKINGYLGQTIFSLDPLLDDNLHLLDGMRVPTDGIYKQFVNNYIKPLYDKYPARFVTESVWQTSVNTYGVCGYWVYDETNKTLRFPKATGFVEGTLDVNALGQLTEAGLPNITGYFGLNANSSESGGNEWGGAFNRQSSSGSEAAEGDGASSTIYNFDASRSSTLYKNNFNKVQPQSISGYMYIVVANKANNGISLNGSGISTEISNIYTKLDDVKNLLGVELYSFAIDQSESNPSLAVEYANNNTSYTPAAMNYTTGVFDYGSWGNAFFMDLFKPCMLKSDGTVDYYLNPNDYSLKEDGTASDYGNPDYDGNAMVEVGQVWISRKMRNGKIHIRIANKRISDEFECITHKKADGTYADKVYRSLFDGCLINNVLRSIAGQTVCKNVAGNNQITYAKANGTGYNIDYVSFRMMINDLLVLMGKSLNTQAVFGQGVTTGSEAAQVQTGTLYDKGMFYGANNTTTAMKVFHMENWWGNIWKFTNGLIANNGRLYYKLCEGTYDGSTVADYNTTGSGYIDSGVTLSGTTSSFIKECQLVENIGLVPSVISGSDSTYYCDGCWFNLNASSLFARFGGASIDGSRCGAFFCNVHDGVGHSSWGTGSALSYKETF